MRHVLRATDHNPSWPLRLRLLKHVKKVSRGEATDADVSAMRALSNEEEGKRILRILGADFDEAGF